MPTGLIQFLRQNIIAFVGFIVVASVAIGGVAYVWGGEKTARFFLATAYLGGQGHAIVSETPREWINGYHDMKIVAQAQVYNPATKKFSTVRPQDANPTSLDQTAEDKAAAKAAAKKAKDSLPKASKP
jgi:hypothetical protein